MIFLSGFISILLLLASYVHAFAPTNSALPRHSALTKIRSLTTIARPTSFLLVSNTEQLNIAFVTGNQVSPSMHFNLCACIPTLKLIDR